MDDRQMALTYPPQAPWITPELVAHAERIADAHPAPAAAPVNVAPTWLTSWPVRLVRTFLAATRRTI